MMLLYIKVAYVYYCFHSSKYLLYEMYFKTEELNIIYRNLCYLINNKLIMLWLLHLLNMTKNNNNNIFLKYIDVSIFSCVSDFQVNRSMLLIPTYVTICLTKPFIINCIRYCLLHD